MQPLLHSSGHQMYAIVGSLPDASTTDASIELLRYPYLSIDYMHRDTKCPWSLSKHVSEPRNLTVDFLNPAQPCCACHELSFGENKLVGFVTLPYVLKVDTKDDRSSEVKSRRRLGRICAKDDPRSGPSSPRSFWGTWRGTC
jgi:hypothetical protein